MSTEPKTYKSKYVDYTYDGKETVNQKLSKDISGTVTKWTNDGYIHYTGDLKDVELTHARYITVQSGKPMARKGGKIIVNNKEKEFFTFRNIGSQTGWCVQYRFLKSEKYPEAGLYINPNSHKKKEKKEKKKIKKIDKLASQREKHDKLLEEYYYDNGNFVGRDKLYEIIKDDSGTAIPHHYIMIWLKKQPAYNIRNGKFDPKEKIVSNRPLIIMELRLEGLLLRCIDVFSSLTFDRALESTDPTEVIEKLSTILDGKRTSIMIIPENLKSNKLLKYLKSLNIKTIENVSTFIKDLDNTKKHPLLKITPEEAIKKDNWKIINDHNALRQTNITPKEL